MTKTEKIRKLESRAKDKSLPRRERIAAQEELLWARFSSDKRPAVSYRKFIVSELLLNASTALIFGGIFIGDMLGNKRSNTPLFGFIFCVFIVFAVAAIAYYSHIKSKFKTEPPDELSNQIMAKSAVYASCAQIIIMLCVIVGVFMFGRVKTITLNCSNCLYLLVTLDYFHTTLTKLIFLILEGGDDEAEDE